MDLRTPRSLTSSYRRARRARFAIEPLESRRLLSSTTSDATTITPNLVTVSADFGRFRGPGFGGGLTNPTPISGALTPSQIGTAYSINQSAITGKGETIAIVDAYNDPNIASDLATFDAQYGLPAASLSVVNEYGQTSGLPQSDPNWSLEIAMDVEWAHAAAPGAKIVLVEANSENVNDLMTAVKTASSMANVVSMSWGGSEFKSETAYDSAAYFGKANVTFVAATGDDGGASGAEWPSVSPDVVGVGGTTLNLTSSGTIASETAWSASGSWWTGYSGSAGGTSIYESAPSYQVAAFGTTAVKRATPDVASDANPSTGLSVFDSVPGTGQTGWFQVGGTSAGAPVWSGIIAAADQARAAVGKSALSSSQTLTLLYSLYRSGSYASAFHDITSGANFVASASQGYDLVTGLGSPVARTLAAAASTSALAPASVAQTVTTHTTATTTVARSRRDIEATTTTSDTITASATTATAAPSTTATTPVVAMAAAPASTASAGTSATSTATTTASTSQLASTFALPAQAVTSAIVTRFDAPSTEPACADVINDPIGTATARFDALARTDGNGWSHAIETPRARLVPLWDTAVDELIDGEVSLPDLEFTAPAPVLDDPGTSASAAVLTGLAIAALGTWRIRSRQRDQSRRQRPSVPEPAGR